jgi:Ca2+-binding EF-hand superfamily protein
MTQNVAEKQSSPKVSENHARFQCNKIAEFNKAFLKLDKHGQKMFDKIILDAVSELRAKGIIVTVQEGSKLGNGHS